MAETRSPRMAVVRYSAGTDSFSRADFDESMQRVEERTAIYAQGLRSARPAAGTEGRYYFCTDDKAVWYDDGAAWSIVGRTTDDLLARASAAAAVALTVKGFTGQSAHLQQWQTSTGSVVASMSVAGLLTVATLTATTVNATTGAITTVNATTVNATNVVATTGVTSPLLQGNAARNGGGGRRISLSDSGPSNVDNLIYPGSAMVWFSASAPPGWLFARGQVVSRTTYAALFAEYGTTHNTGGEAGTDFRLPDMQGLVPIGANGTYVLGATGGSATKVLATGNLPAHTHTMAHTHSINHNHPVVSSGDDTPDHYHQQKVAVPTGAVATYRLDYNNDGLGTPFAQDGVITDGASTRHTHSVDVPEFIGTSGASSAASTGSVGSASPVDVMNPWRGVNWIIKT